MFLHCTYILKIPACNYICNYTADPSLTLKPTLKPTHTTIPVPYHTSIAAKVIYNTTWAQ